jgi:DNA-binding transcriptional ArsR family regulator
MSEDCELLPELDRLIHEPARLAILVVLASCERADFLFLERATGLTRGNLSVQLSRLEQAALIEIEKTIVQKRTLTTARLLRRGRTALEDYWSAMEAMRALAQTGEPAVGTKNKTRAMVGGRKLAPAKA